MPIYEYKCIKCGHLFERLCRIDEDNPQCPECGDNVEKLISAGSFDLTGDGWYKPGKN